MRCGAGDGEVAGPAHCAPLPFERAGGARGEKEPSSCHCSITRLCLASGRGGGLGSPLSASACRVGGGLWKPEPLSFWACTDLPSPPSPPPPVGALCSSEWGRWGKEGRCLAKQQPVGKSVRGRPQAEQPGCMFGSEWNGQVGRGSTLGWLGGTTPPMPTDGWHSVLDPPWPTDLWSAVLPVTVAHKVGGG